MYGDPVVHDHYFSNQHIRTPFDALFFWAPDDRMLEQYREALHRAATTVFEHRQVSWLPVRTKLEATERLRLLRKFDFDLEHGITRWRIDHVSNAVARANDDERRHFLVCLGAIDRFTSKVKK
jgi:hypothetical protein